MGQFETAGIPLESCISLYKNYIILGDPSKLNLHVWSIPKHLNVLYQPYTSVDPRLLISTVYKHPKASYSVSNITL